MLNVEVRLVVSGREFSLDSFASALVADIRLAVREEISPLLIQPAVKKQDMSQQDEHKTPPLAVSKREAARLLGVCTRTLENYISLKFIRSVRIGRRVLVPMRSVREVAARGIPWGRQKNLPENRPSDRV